MAGNRERSKDNIRFTQIISNNEQDFEKRCNNFFMPFAVTLYNAGNSK